MPEKERERERNWNGLLVEIFINRYFKLFFIRIFDIKINNWNVTGAILIK